MFSVVIIDDEMLVLGHLKSFINWEEYGYSVVGTFSSVQEAIEFIKEYSVDVILSDIKMPDMSGIDLAKLLQKCYPGIKLVFMSAHRDFEYAREAIRYNVLEYITKPITRQELTDALTKISFVLEKEKPHKRFIGKNQTIDKAIAFMKENYKTINSLEDVAKHVNLSPVYFGALFKQQVNQNMNAYLNRIRIEKAKELLLSSHAKIETVGEMVGFKSLPYFYKTFKSFTGITPVQFKSRALEGRL